MAWPNGMASAATAIKREAAKIEEELTAAVASR